MINTLEVSKVWDAIDPKGCLIFGRLLMTCLMSVWFNGCATTLGEWCMTYHDLSPENPAWKFGKLSELSMLVTVLKDHPYSSAIFGNFTGKFGIPTIFHGYIIINCWQKGGWGDEIAQQITSFTKRFNPSHRVVELRLPGWPQPGAMLGQGIAWSKDGKKSAIIKLSRAK